MHLRQESVNGMSLLIDRYLSSNGSDQLIQCYESVEDQDEFYSSISAWPNRTWELDGFKGLQNSNLLRFTVISNNTYLIKLGFECCKARSALTIFGQLSDSFARSWLRQWLRWTLSYSHMAAWALIHLATTPSSWRYDIFYIIGNTIIILE